MTYLQLINKVLTRLREDSITEAEFGTDPYWNFIGSAVNDAKSMVENAWQWGALRGTDSVRLLQSDVQVSGPNVAIPSSSEVDYVIKDVRVYPNATASASLTGVRESLRQQGAQYMMSVNYQNPSEAPTGQPREYAVTGRATTSAVYPFSSGQVGELMLTLFPYPTDGEYWLEVDRVAHQAELENADDVLLVPALPVYSLATALASRERGEVGGTPTSELFAVADSYLSDAIAYDSSHYPNELDWYANTNESNTNVRFS